MNWFSRSVLLPLVSALLVGLAPAFAAPLPEHLRIPATDEGLPGTGPIRRHDWFHGIWNERRGSWIDRVEQDRHAVVFLGDSITQGWGDDLGGAFPGMKTANRGISGDTTRGVLIRLQEDVLALQPRAVVLLIGTNDLEERAEPWTAASNVRLIIDRLRDANPEMPVVLCEVFPSSETMRRPHGQIQRLNHLLREAVRDQPQVTLLDTWTLFANEQHDAKPEEFPDLLHPNEAGYTKWAAALRPVLATLGLLETTADAFTPEPGFTALFNGRDLTGWGYRPTSAEDVEARQQWRAASADAADWPLVTEASDFAGMTASPDGRFVAQQGRLIVTTPSSHRSIQQLWTTAEFGDDFVLKLEFRATPNADSGIYVRGPQLQCRDYGLAGPYHELQRYRPQDWNEIVITVRGGVAHATCNGEVLEAAMPVPGSGPIGLEGDRGQMEYRRIRWQRL